MEFREIRQRFLEYFRSRDHEIISSSSLIPQEDPTLLFTNAGMVQFKRLFLGEEKRSYTRAATSQKCVRAGGKHNDLENVGYTPRHHTFFEMLGNFSFGDYFKKEAIEWAWELLTEEYRLPREELHVSVYLDDDEAYRIWEDNIGIPRSRIVRLGGEENFWAMGETGPCGPCSEIHIDQGEEFGCGRPDCAPGCDCDRYLEIWNLVFTQYERAEDGTLTPLPKPNIDTGMGLERLASVVQGVGSNYGTDLFKGIMGTLEDLSETPYGEDGKRDVAFRVIADHARAISFLVGDGILPSNEGRGYVLRRIIRRAIRFGQVLGLEEPFLRRVCSKVIETMGDDYSELARSKDFIEGVAENEEKRFADTLHYSMRVLRDEIDTLRAKEEDIISGDVVFRLYDTYGLSPDIVQDVARDEGLQVDMEGFQEAMSRQRALSQESWKGSGEEEIPAVYRAILGRGLKIEFVGYEELKCNAVVSAMVVDGEESSKAEEGTEVEVVLDRTCFYGQSGGQVGDTGRIINENMEFTVADTVKYGQDLIVHIGRLDSGRLSVGDAIEARVDRERRRETACNHSSTHLLHAALREVLGAHVKQAGSLVAPGRLRFDFTHFARVSPEMLAEVELIVNRHIRQNLEINVTEMAREEAMKTGAVAIFEERYGERVRIVKIGDGVSMELCGGTHTERTGDIGLFRITGENAVAANIRRIEALTGSAALEFDQRQDRELREAAELLKTTPHKVSETIERLLADKREKDKEIEALRAKVVTKESESLLSRVNEVDGIKVLAEEVRADSPKGLRESADRLRDKLDSGVIVLGARQEGKVMLICVVTKDLTYRFKAGEIVNRLAEKVGGKGGGRADMAQGGGSKPEALGAALASVEGLLKAAG